MLSFETFRRSLFVGVTAIWHTFKRPHRINKSRNPTSMAIAQQPAPVAASSRAAHAMLRMPA
jgi:hypothetical protein